MRNYIKSSDRKLEITYVVLQTGAIILIVSKVCGDIFKRGLFLISESKALVSGPLINNGTRCKIIFTKNVRSAKNHKTVYLI